MASQSTELQRLATLGRGETEEVRISLDEFTSDDGRAHRYVSIRKWYFNEDKGWLPTKAGITVRRGEILEVGKALRAALDALDDTPTRPEQPRRMEAQPPKNPNYCMDTDGADAYF